MTEQPPQYNVGDVVNGHRWNGATWEPVASAPIPPTPPTKKAWYKRKRIIIPAALVAVVVVLAATSGGDDKTVTDEPQVPQASTPAKSEETKKPAEPAVPGVGDKVRDGKFEFTVTKVKTGIDSVGGEFLNETAQGSYTLVTIKVENIGDEPQTFFSDNVKGIDSKDREVASDSTATLYANDNNDTWISEINPGNSIEGVVAFDVAKGVKLTALELHDSAFSGGVEVKLK